MILDTVTQSYVILCAKTPELARDAVGPREDGKLVSFRMIDGLHHGHDTLGKCAAMWRKASGGAEAHSARMLMIQSIAEGFGINS